MVRLKQNIIFVHDLSTGNRWSEKYRVKFNPTEMEIKEISYYDDGNQTGIFQLKTSLDSTQGIALVQESTFPIQTESVLQFDNAIGSIGSVEFWLEDSSGDLAAQSGTIFIHTVFIKKGDKTKIGV